ncbi:MAG: aminoacyl-histidine dipeptidase, partial [Clostridia bacterium]|nr:aminoacyl-histidine dipeptidase [Clostridia bacterium]
AIEPVITAIHAGLECGILGEKLGDIDMIAFGPQIYDVHSPDERVSIKSIESTWAYLCEVLKKIR